MLHVCPVCAQSFHGKPCVKFCSRECFGVSQRTAKDLACPVCGKIALSHLSWPSKYCGMACYTSARQKAAVCGFCKSTFKPRRASSIYCGRRCRGLAQRKRLSPRPCPHCASVFSPSRKNPVFCSLRCYGLSQRGVHPRAGNNFTPRQKRLIRQRDGRKCRRCGKTSSLHFDHVVPIYRGGTNAIANGQILCEDCHKKKTKRDLDRNHERLPA